VQDGCGRASCIVEDRLAPLRTGDESLAGERECSKRSWAVDERSESLRACIACECTLGQERGPEKQRRAQASPVQRHHALHRLHELGQFAQKPSLFAAGAEKARDVELLKVAQTAVDDAQTIRGRAAAGDVLLDNDRIQAAAPQLERHRRALDAAADDDCIARVHRCAGRPLDGSSADSSVSPFATTRST
jgi:hypothetical protein